MTKLRTLALRPKAEINATPKIHLKTFTATANRIRVARTSAKKSRGCDRFESFNGRYTEIRCIVSDQWIFVANVRFLCSRSPWKLQTKRAVECVSYTSKLMEGHELPLAFCANLFSGLLVLWMTPRSHVPSDFSLWSVTNILRVLKCI